jgi:glycosyltransferase involved in cell wall biosynthesis
MSSGVPVLATDTLSVGEIVENDENGLLVQPSADRRELADKLNILLAESDKAERYSKNARQTIIDKASVGVVGDRLRNLYNNLSDRQRSL